MERVEDWQQIAKHWDVSVSRDGENILTIGHNFLSGKPDLDAVDEATIRHAAEHLLSFIGRDWKIAQGGE